MAICWLNSLTGPHSFRGQYLLPWLFYLAPPGFSSDWQGLQSSLWHAGYLVAPCRMHGSLFSCSMQTLSCSMWDLAPWPGIGPGPRALGMWSLSHWTTTASYDPLMFQMRKLKLRNVSTSVRSYSSCGGSRDPNPRLHILNHDLIYDVKLAQSLIVSPSHFMKQIHLHSPKQAFSPF